MRDHSGRAISVCSMENIDPVGVHTGDSFVVAPALTLDAGDLARLRQMALDIVTELEIEGGCNCQFAFHPETKDVYVIEVNPRVSRSSALASKATGYPIAKVTALIALGYLLDEIKFDRGRGHGGDGADVGYIVMRCRAGPSISSRTLPHARDADKATGEVMAIGGSVEEALMKGRARRGDRLRHAQPRPRTPRRSPSASGAWTTCACSRSLRR
jgi:carbamoyl-phosphate synthase large subunit